jgi:hypothetical protein
MSGVRNPSTGEMPADVDARTADLEVEVLGRRLPARVLEERSYDSSGSRLRG